MTEREGIGGEDQAFSKADRLLSRRDFTDLKKGGRKVSNRHFLLVFRPGRANRTRLGITVSKKVGGAVVRNRIKRLVREWYRTHKNGISGRYDINVISRKEAAAVSAGRINASLCHVFTKLPGDAGA